MILLILYGQSGVARIPVLGETFPACWAAADLLLRIPGIAFAGCYGGGVLV